MQAQELSLLPRLHLRRIVRVIEAQALDRMCDRPFHELGPERAAELELERARAWLLDRPANPEAVINRAKQRLAPIFAVEEHAITGSARRDLGGGLDREQFEVADALARRARGVGDLLELRTMVDRQRHDRGRLGPARRRPVDVIERLVAAQRPVGRAVFEKAAKLGPGWVFG